MRIDRFRLKAILASALVLQSVGMMLVLMPGSILPLLVEAVVAILILFALWGFADDVHLRQESRAPLPPSDDLFSYGQLRNQAMGNLAEQFGRVREELAQVCDIIGAATESLSGSVTGLHVASSDQQVALAALLKQLEEQTVETRQLGSTDAEGSLSGEVDDLITRFSDALESLSATGESVRVQAESLARRADELAVSDAPANVLKESRLIACMADGVAQEAQMLAIGGAPLADEARDSVRHMWRKSRELNHTITQRSEVISEISEHIQRHVQDGIRSLQYEDMVSQLTMHMSQRVEALERYIQSLIAQQWGDAEDLRKKSLALRTSELQAVVSGGEACFDGLQHKKSVHARDMSEGEIDLF